MQLTVGIAVHPEQKQSVPVTFLPLSIFSYFYLVMSAHFEWYAVTQGKSDLQ